MRKSKRCDQCGAVTRNGVLWHLSTCSQASLTLRMEIHCVHAHDGSEVKTGESVSAVVRFPEMAGIDRALLEEAKLAAYKAMRDAIDAGTREPLTLAEAVDHVLSGDVGEGLDASAIATACHALDRLGMLADGIVIDTPHVHEILYAQEERRYTRGHVLGVRARWRIMDAAPAGAGEADESARQVETAVK